MNAAEKKLLDLAEKATPLPWRAELADIDDEDEDGNPIQYGPAGVTPIFTIDCGEYHGLSNADASYIVAAANAVPRLIAESERLLRRIEDLRARLPRHPLVRPVDGVPTPCGCIDCREVQRILAADDAASKEEHQ